MSSSLITPRKPGGSFTQPFIDPLTDVLSFQVYVRWELVGTYDSDAEATQALLDVVSEKSAVVEITVA